MDRSWGRTNCRERVWVVAGPKFRSKDGKKIIVRNALYGLKSSGGVFRAFLAETLNAMGYGPIYNDLDLWLRPAVKPYGFKYYEYILCYVNDVLYIFHNPRRLMKRIHENFKLKDNKIEPPDIYSGAKLAKMKLESDKHCWTMLPEQYVKAEVKNVEEYLASSGKRLPPKCVTPLSINYSPWPEDSPELMADSVK